MGRYTEQRSSTARRRRHEGEGVALIFLTVGGKLKCANFGHIMLPTPHPTPLTAHFGPWAQNTTYGAHYWRPLKLSHSVG
jgi:hypothetical protein